MTARRYSERTRGYESRVSANFRGRRCWATRRDSSRPQGVPMTDIWLPGCDAGVSGARTDSR
jgi:hypothetical protein